MSAVRSPIAADLTKNGAGLGHDVGYAKSATDLDELPPGDDHFPSGRHRRQHQQRRRRIVVHHHCRRGARQPAEEPFGVDVTASAPSFLDVVLEIGVSGGQCGDSGGRVHAEGSTTQVRVEDHAGRVDDSPERRRRIPRQPRRHAFLDVFDHTIGRAAGRHPCTHDRRLGAQGADQRGPPIARFERCHRWTLTKLFDGWDGAHLFTCYLLRAVCYGLYVPRPPCHVQRATRGWVATRGM